MTRLLPLLALLACTGGEDDDSGTVDSGSSDTGTTWAHLVHPGFDSGLDQTSACSDTWLQAWDATDELALEIYVGGIVAEAGSATASRTVDLSSPGSDWVRAVAATPIADNYCTDGLVVREVHETWEASSGTLVIAVDASSTTADPTASITLTDAVFAYQGDTVAVSNFSASEITVITAWGG